MNCNVNLTCHLGRSPQEQFHFAKCWRCQTVEKLMQLTHLDACWKLKPATGTKSRQPLHAVWPLQTLLMRSHPGGLIWFDLVWFGLIWFDIAFWEPATNQVGNSWQIWALPLCTSIDLPFPQEWIVLECVWHVWSVWWFCSFPFLRSSLTCAWQSSRSVTYQGSITVYWAKIQSCDLEMGWKLASVSGSLLWRKLYDSNKINLSLNLLIWSRNKPGNLSLSLKHAQRLHRSCSTSIGLQTLAETNGQRRIQKLRQIQKLGIQKLLVGFRK